MVLNSHGDSIILDFSKVNDSIIVMTTNPSGVKPYALTKITYENGYFMHTNLHSFFSLDGATKYFVIAQGLEWAGGDTFDDYC